MCMLLLLKDIERLEVVLTLETEGTQDEQEAAP